MRLIDADDIVYESIDSSDTSRYEYYYGTGIMAVRKEDIDAMPTIEERKTGRWDCSDDMYETAICSACGWDTTDPWSHIRHWFNYCPNCGADMRGEQDG